MEPAVVTAAAERAAKAMEVMEVPGGVAVVVSMAGSAAGLAALGCVEAQWAGFFPSRDSSTICLERQERCASNRGVGATSIQVP